MKKSILFILVIIFSCILISCTSSNSNTVKPYVNKTKSNIVCDEHKPITDYAVEATCEHVGLTEGSHCSVCGEVIVQQQEIPQLEHTIVIDPQVDATCENEGWTEGSHCSVCGKVIEKQSKIKPSGHRKVVHAEEKATCVDSGYSSWEECSVCNKILKEKNVIPALGHKERITKGKEATCTSSGYTDNIVCDRCGKVIQAKTTVPALGHNIINDPAVAATCTKSGLTAGSHCDRCNKVITKQNTIKATGHTVVNDPAVKETCTENGYTAGSHCSKCGEVFTAQKKIEKLGHDLKEVTVNATCTEDGYHGGCCTRCNYKEVWEEYKAPGHNEIIDREEREPTCVTYGNTRSSHCSRCGEKLSVYEVIPKLGHIKGDRVVTKEASCTSVGSYEVRCTRENCNHLFESGEIPSFNPNLVHIFRDPQITGSEYKMDIYCVTCGMLLYKNALIDARGIIRSHDLAVGGYSVSAYRQLFDPSYNPPY